MRVGWKMGVLTRMKFRRTHEVRQKRIGGCDLLRNNGVDDGTANFARTILSGESE